MANRVCPECGHGTFTATVITRAEYTFEVGPSGDLYTVQAEVMDGCGPPETIQCTDCCEEWEPASLITAEDYDAQEDEDA